MTEPLFQNLREQREGPITVDGFTLVPCPVCDGIGVTSGGAGGDITCHNCGGGGQVLVRLC